MRVRLIGAFTGAVRLNSGIAMDEKPRTSSFGFQDLTEEEKARRVRQVFTRVSSKYDLMNDAMSFGLHRAWKAALINWLQPRRDRSLLDVAGGTGDIAFRYLDRSPGAEVTVLDFTPGMLDEGRRRAARAGLEGRIGWVAGDAMSLPFPCRSFDFCTIGFGLRNFSGIEAALAEAFRILKRGGRLMTLEFSRLRDPNFRRLYDFYSFKVIPLEGQLIANDSESYRYLVESIRRFPDQDALAGLIEKAGFQDVSYRDLSMGVAAMHSGWKL